MGLSADVLRAQVDRLVRSKTFEASEVHRHLLRYLAEKTIAGESDRLKEYVVGLEAFGKPSTYDPKHDSNVRLQVGRLRQKISAYYQTEASDDPVLIALPKGAFKLEFREAPGPAQKAETPRWWTARRVAIAVSTALVLTILWAGVATVRLVRLSHDTAGVAGRWTPGLESIWAPFLESKRPILLCFGTPLFIRFPGFGFFRDPKTNQWPEVERSDRISAIRKAVGDQEMIPWYAYTGTGEASAAVLVSSLLSTRKSGITLTRSNILSWEQLVDDDVVFVGPPKFNPQLQIAALARDLVMESDGIRNLKPQPGEASFLPDRMVSGKQSEGETYALISSLPGLSGEGHLLVIAGNASADTFAAGQWLTEPLRAAELASRLRNRSRELPRYYEVVLKVAFKQGIPVNSSYVLHHEINGPARAAGE